MTNFEKVKKMNQEEMGEFIEELLDVDSKIINEVCRDCRINGDGCAVDDLCPCPFDENSEIAKRWLEMEVEK